MTKAFKSPCQHPGCGQFAVSGNRFCVRHLEQLKQENRLRDRQRGTRTERGYSNVWLKSAKLFLTQHPLCAECLRQGKTTPATEVDHIVPHKGNQKLFWDSQNWQALCHECHSRKTATEDGGFGRKCTPRGSLKNL